jgi:hypothetical protein
LEIYFWYNISKLKRKEQAQFLPCLKAEVSLREMMNKIKSHVFRGKRYKIKFKRVSKKLIKCMKNMEGKESSIIGACEGPPSLKNKSITIDPVSTGLEALHVAVDEGIHACLWDLDNDAVDEVSTSVSRFLWRLGYRDSEAAE